MGFGNPDGTPGKMMTAKYVVLAILLASETTAFKVTAPALPHRALSSSPIVRRAVGILAQEGEEPAEVVAADEEAPVAAAEPEAPAPAPAPAAPPAAAEEMQEDFNPALAAGGLAVVAAAFFAFGGGNTDAPPKPAEPPAKVAPAPKAAPAPKPEAPKPEAPKASTSPAPEDAKAAAIAKAAEASKKTEVAGEAEEAEGEAEGAGRWSDPKKPEKVYSPLEFDLSKELDKM